jgi:YD repeat-containing protein
MSGGLCPGCGASGTVSFEIGEKPERSRALQRWLLAGAIYLAVSAAVLVFVGHHLIRSVAHRADIQYWSKTYAPHVGPVARLDELKGNGRIYLVQMGEHKAPYSLDDFVQQLHSKYGLDVQVLPAMAVDKSAWDSERKQYAAELLNGQIEREHPDLAADPNSYLIGFTDGDMYSVLNGWKYTRTQRYESRFAVISTNEEMRWYNWARAKGDDDAIVQRFEARVRRILLKDVAVLYWRLPLNNDPTSVIFNRLDPGIPAEDIYESDLDPARTPSGEYQGNSGIFLVYSTKDGIKPLPGALVQECQECSGKKANLPGQDESMEVFEVYLNSGLLIDRHTDFNLPDTVPIQFQRATRDGWSGSNPFGTSGTDSYDEFLSSANNVRISVVHADSNRDNLLRVPLWLPALPLVKYVDTDYSGKYYEMRWRSAPFEHYDLKRYDGEVKTYLPCNSPTEMCYLTGIRNAQGQELKFERDSSRRLLRLTSPNGSGLRLSYGPSNHITEIDDSRGRVVRYGYDEQNRLISVTYPSGEVFHYEYDATQHLLTFSVAPDAQTAPRLVLRNEYTNGKIIRQTLGNGAAYNYSYTLANDGSVNGASVRAPDGRIFNIDIGDDYSTVREQTPQPTAQEGPQVPR